MENSGLFSGFIKIDEKTNKTHGFEHFTCNPLRDPHFEKICAKISQLITAQNQSFHHSDEKTRRHDFIEGSFERYPTPECNLCHFSCIWINHRGIGMVRKATQAGVHLRIELIVRAHTPAFRPYRNSCRSVSIILNSSTRRPGIHAFQTVQGA